MTCGSGNTLPSAVFGASAHPPQAPIWLDPSGCPPGRVFHFWHRFRWKKPRRVGLRPADFPLAWVDRPIFPRVFPDETIEARLATRATLPCSLTVKSDDNTAS